MPLNLRRIFRAAQLLTLLFIIINVFISKKECSGQTFHYSHGWTNGKRSDPLIDRIDTIQKKGRSFDNFKFLFMPDMIDQQQRRRRMAFKRDDKLVHFLLDENIRNMDKDGSEMFLPERYPSTLS